MKRSEAYGAIEKASVLAESADVRCGFLPLHEQDRDFVAEMEFRWRALRRAPDLQAQYDACVSLGVQLVVAMRALDDRLMARPESGVAA